ncbi:4'-phosphopantetheinyl transferase family protein [Luteimonas arsenica]|uniref:4'-phosphopantetheinyl transferase family protein n=1 Tax=Luteimonas arsenica TaxID=1586242 RepID=UPI00140555A9|nr:4'-phosphopantetheinyl transferase superfamily protein [Luteimonas arsenica]
MECASAPGCDSSGRTGLTQAFASRLAVGGLAAAAADGVVVAVFDLGDWSAHAPQAAAIIDPTESARAARQRDPANRDALVLAYALHRLLLAQLLGCTPDRVGIHRDAKGCPRLPGDRLHTSLSHAGRCVAVAATATGPVGIDIEADARARGMHDIAARVAHPEELQSLAGLPAADRDRALLRLWVRKEALLKAAGIGLEQEMEEFMAPEGVALALPGDTFPGRTAELRMLDGVPGWSLALAAEPGAPVRMEVCAASP